MTAPSNANTSGLQVVAWRIREQPETSWSIVYDHEDHHLAIADGFESEPYAVTAASAQARIAELSVSMTQQSDQWSERLLVMADRATAAEARADRLAKALKPFAAIAGAGDQGPKDNAVWAGQDGLRITYGDFRAARAALQQEG